MRGLIVVFLLAAVPLARADSAEDPVRRAPRGISRIELAGDWALQSSAAVPEDGAELSTGGYVPEGWYPTSVPSTVVAALVKNKVYSDPYFGLNLRSIPGTAYDFGDNFASLPMPADSPFAVSWWYRTSFSLSLRVRGKRLWLNFDSINYSANIWLNGRRIAGSGEVRGMYRKFEFDVTGIAVPGRNTLAVEVFAPTESDLGITFVDWNPLPADKDMGIVRGVYILASGPVALRNTQVVTKVDPALGRAHLTLFADLKNGSGAAVRGTIEAAIGEISVSRDVTLAAGESARIAFAPEEYPQLNIEDPQLWWPYGLGPQNLYTAQVQFRSGSDVSDREEVRFGIREFTSELDAKQHRLFRVNGRKILIRGAGWTHDMLLRVDEEREENEIRYVRDMHLNTLRLEGKMLDEHLYDLADRYGIMLMPGWCCCNFWEKTEEWTPEHYAVARESLRDQARQLRNHASVFVFLYGSDTAPSLDAESMYLGVLAEEDWPNPSLASATDNTTAVGRTGVKMRGPYAWVGPNYWLLDTDRGGAFGFATEIGPGHAIPVVESLREMFPADHLWPPDEYWIYHEATPTYPNLDEYTAALGARYGAAKSLADYAMKSQVVAYEGERAMFEAYGRNKYTSTGVIQWMLNNAWPSIVWHLYDWYLRPGGGYFGAKKANEPLHVQYSYDDRSIVVVNSLYTAFRGYTVTAKVYNMDLTEKFSNTASIDIAEDSSTRVFVLPDIADLSRTYFVRLALYDPDGNRVSSNFYWLSSQPDVYDWNASNAWETPVTTYADLSALESLPAAEVMVTRTSEESGTDRVEHVRMRNPSSQLAFFLRLTVIKSTDGSDIAPVYWDDNFFELMPGEEREISARFSTKLLGGAASRIRVEGWNVAASSN